MGEPAAYGTWPLVRLVWCERKDGQRARTSKSEAVASVG